MSSSEDSLKMARQYFEECLDPEKTIEEVNKKYLLCGTSMKIALEDIYLSTGDMYPFCKPDLFQLSLAPEKETYGNVMVNDSLSIRCKMPLRRVPKGDTTSIFTIDPHRDDWVINVSVTGTEEAVLERICERVGYFLEEKDARIYCKLKHGVIDDETRSIK